jgi:hypothetical protein
MGTLYSSKETNKRIVGTLETDCLPEHGTRVSWDSATGETTPIRQTLIIGQYVPRFREKKAELVRSNDGPPAGWRERVASIMATLPANDSDIVPVKNWQTDTRLVRARDSKRRETLHSVAAITRGSFEPPVAANDNFVDEDNADFDEAPVLDSSGNFRPSESEIDTASSRVCTMTTRFDKLGRVCQWGGFRFGPRMDFDGQWGLVKWEGTDGVWRQPWLDSKPKGASQEKSATAKPNRYCLEQFLDLGPGELPAPFPFKQQRLVNHAAREHRTVVIRGVVHHVGRSFLRELGVSGEIDLGLQLTRAELPRTKTGGWQDNTSLFHCLRKTTQGNPGAGKIDWPIDDYIDRIRARDRLEALDDATLDVLDMACTDASAEDIATAFDYPPGKYAQRRGALMVNDALDAAAARLAA